MSGFKILKNRNNDSHTDNGELTSEISDGNLIMT